MTLKSTLTQFIGISALLVATISNATNFTCPQPAEIQSTDFTTPSIWIAPPVAHSAAGVVGVGLGGTTPKDFIAAEATYVNHKKGWVCVYNSEGGVAANDYETKILQTIEANPYLKKYTAKVKKAFAEAEPYLKKYPETTPIGFIGYQSK